MTMNSGLDYSFTAEWDRRAEREGVRRKQGIAHIRSTCLETCASDLAPHRAGVDQARHAVEILLTRIEDLSPAKKEAQAVEDLAGATASGDESAATRAATTLQQIRSGAHSSAVELLQADVNWPLE